MIKMHLQVLWSEKFCLFKWGGRGEKDIKFKESGNINGAMLKVMEGPALALLKMKWNYNQHNNNKKKINKNKGIKLTRQQRQQIISSSNNFYFI